MASSIIQSPMDAEQDAILGLLQVGSGKSPPAVKQETERPLKKTKNEPEEDSDEEETAMGKAEAGDVIPSPRPQPISPLPENPQSFSHMGMPLRKLSKKRKDHVSVDGQFEDAEDTYLQLNGFSEGMKRPHAASSAKELVGGYPPAPPTQRHSPGDHTVPPPPHLIQQTSNDYAPPVPALQAQSSAELARQALAYQHQRSLLENGMFPPQYAAMMASGHMKGTMGENLMERDRRMQIEAIMALQTQMHMARHGLGPAAVASGCQPQANLTPSHPAAAAAAAAGGGYGLQRSQVPVVPLQPIDRAYDTFRRTCAGTVGEVLKPEDVAKSEAAEGGLALGRQVPYSTKEPTRVEMEDDEGSNSEGDSRMESSKGPKTMSTKERYENYKPPTSWGEITRAPRMPPVEADEKMEHPIVELSENDVMLGRGGLSNQNTGNIRFRNMVRNYRTHYCTAPKGDKGALARYLCNYVRAMGGRFLQKRKDSKDSDHWYEVGDEKAVSKCGQALREGTADFAKSKAARAIASLGDRAE